VRTLFAAFLCGLLTASAQAAPGILIVRVFDAGHKGAVVPARVNVIGSDNAFYEPDPARNPLSEYSLKRKGNRANVGPLRYYGSFFYTDGSFQVALPAGPARVEVRKGYGYYTSIGEAEILAGKTTNYDAVLERVIDMPRYGWHTMDTHLHFDRGESQNDHHIAQLLAAEDVELGHILTVRSAKGFGKASIYSDGPYSMASGREATSPALGHVNLLLIDQLIPAIRNSPSPARNVPLASIYDQTRAANGALQHDHAGYGQEIYSDVVLGKSDLVELLQFGLYRPEIGLDGYYLLLNSGFRYPLSGGSDYPVCRTMSDSRTFVADGPSTSFQTAMGRLLRGEAFATSGPLLFLSVNGKGPGTDVEYSGSNARNVSVQVKAVSGDLPFDTVEIVQDGRVAAEWHGPATFHHELRARIRLDSSSWIAARCSGPNTVHAHTNPVWVYFNGFAPFKKEAAAELLRRIQVFATSKISPEAVKVAEAARNKVDQILKNGEPPRPMPADSRRFPVSTSSASLFPPSLPRPKRLAPVTVEGAVVDSSGHPVEGATVSARGLDSGARTDTGGRFLLSRVDANLPLFLRVSKTGHVSTNTAYLNPRSPKENLRILLLTIQELQDVMRAWSGSKDAPPERNAVLLVNTIGADGKPISGLKLTASPAGTTRFGYPDKPGPVQVVGITDINFQPSFPAQSNDHEPNVIITANSLAKDIVMPAFTGQVSYAVIVAIPSAGRD
jgi:hypothetical protein